MTLENRKELLLHVKAPCIFMNSPSSYTLAPASMRISSKVPTDGNHVDPWLHKNA